MSFHITKNISRPVKGLGLRKKPVSGIMEGRSSSADYSNEKNSSKEETLSVMLGLPKNSAMVDPKKQSFFKDLTSSLQEPEPTNDLFYVRHNKFNDNSKQTKKIFHSSSAHKYYQVSLPFSQTSTPMSGSRNIFQPKRNTADGTFNSGINQYFTLQQLQTLSGTDSPKFSSQPLRILKIQKENKRILTKKKSKKNKTNQNEPNSNSPSDIIKPPLPHHKKIQFSPYSIQQKNETIPIISHKKTNSSKNKLPEAFSISSQNSLQGSLLEKKDQTPIFLPKEISTFLKKRSTPKHQPSLSVKGTSPEKKILENNSRTIDLTINSRNHVKHITSMHSKDESPPSKYRKIGKNRSTVILQKNPSSNKNKTNSNSNSNVSHSPLFTQYSKNVKDRELANLRMKKNGGAKIHEISNSKLLGLSIRPQEYSIETSERIHSYPSSSNQTLISFSNDEKNKSPIKEQKKQNSEKPKNENLNLFRERQKEIGDVLSFMKSSSPSKNKKSTSVMETEESEEGEVPTELVSELASPQNVNIQISPLDSFKQSDSIKLINTPKSVESMKNSAHRIDGEKHEEEAKEIESQLKTNLLKLRLSLSQVPEKETELFSNSISALLTPMSEQKLTLLNEAFESVIKKNPHQYGELLSKIKNAYNEYWGTTESTRRIANSPSYCDQMQDQVKGYKNQIHILAKEKDNLSEQLQELKQHAKKEKETTATCLQQINQMKEKIENQNEKIVLLAAQNQSQISYINELKEKIGQRHNPEKKSFEVQTNFSQLNKEVETENLKNPLSKKMEDENCKSDEDNEKESLIQRCMELENTLQQYQAEIEYFRQRENKLMYLLYTLQKRGFPVQSIFEKEIKDIPTYRFSENYQPENDPDLPKNKKSSDTENKQVNGSASNINSSKDDNLCLSETENSEIKLGNSFDSSVTYEPLCSAPAKNTPKPEIVPKLNFEALPQYESFTSDDEEDNPGNSNLTTANYNESLKYIENFYKKYQIFDKNRQKESNFQAIATTTGNHLDFQQQKTSEDLNQKRKHNNTTFDESKINIELSSHHTAPLEHLSHDFFLERRRNSQKDKQIFRNEIKKKSNEDDLLTDPYVLTEKTIFPAGTPPQMS